MRKGTNPDVGALARTTAAGYNRDGCEAQRGRSVRQHRPSSALEGARVPAGRSKNDNRSRSQRTGTLLSPRHVGLWSQSERYKAAGLAAM